MLTCGLLGRKLGHSYSPAIHRMLGEAMGDPYEYELYEKEPGEVEDFLRRGEWDGLNVTIPYKKTAAALCDELSGRAKKLGSVNTVVKRRGAGGRVILYGDNTDYAGFLALASKAVEKSRVSFFGSKCLVLGSGGAGVTVQLVLEDLGAAKAIVISRQGPETYRNLNRHVDADFIVNATPVGMFPGNGESPLDLCTFSCPSAVFDLIYNPSRTALLMRAEKLGIPAYGGLTMLAAQAKAAAELFTEKSVPDGTIERIVRAIEGSQRSVALIGMPGCGKSSIGRLLAERTGRPFFDADEEIARRAGKSIPHIFAEDGEGSFRRLETQVLSDLGKLSGAVIATGGGCVTRPENYALLHQNSLIVWLRRELEALPKDGRPILQSVDIKTIYENRKALYEAFADAAVDNDTTPGSCVSKLLRLLVQPGERDGCM